MEAFLSYGNYPLLVVLLLFLEISLRVLANGTYGRSILALVYITAVTTLPFYFLFACEYGTVNDPLIQTAVTFLVLSFYLCDHTEERRNLREAFLIGNLCKFGIEFVPLLLFALCCSKQVLGSCTDNSGRI